MSENGTHTPTLTVAEAAQLFVHITQRLALRHGVTFEGDRDLYAALGYKRELTYRAYRDRYERGGIAAGLVDGLLDKTWQIPPLVREVGKPDETSEGPFEQALTVLADRHQLWRTLKRLDLQASLGRFAVAVLGLRGQPDYATEARPVRGPEDLLHLQVFSEEHAEIVELVSDESLPLFGMPLRYQIDFSRSEAGSALAQGLIRPALAGRFQQRVVVHASRVLHVAHKGLEDDIIGTPLLKAGWNDFDNLDKVVGGIAEMVWKDAKRRLIAALREGARLDPEDEAALDDRVKQFAHYLMDVLQVQNIDVTQLAGSVPDVSNIIDKIVELLGGTYHYPKRLLMGSERGELSSAQDEGNLAATVQSRQILQAEPGMLRPLFTKFIALRILPTPRQGFAIEWQPLISETETERAATAKAWAETIAVQAGPHRSPNEVIPDEIFLTDVLGWSQEQAARIQDELGTEDAGGPRRPSAGEDAEKDDADAPDIDK